MLNASFHLPVKSPTSLPSLLSGQRLFTRTLTIISLLIASVASAETYPDSATQNADDMSSLLELDLKSLMEIQVITPTQKPQQVDQAPAIVSVVTKQDISQFRYQSVAQALQQVPGFHCVYDYLSYNCGVRGINGGLRAYSKIFKVMINGMVIAFRSDSANYLGPELLPMSAIERIEVIRGPASALYGANAYLGVINIITKTAGPGSQSRYQLELSRLQEDTGGHADILYQNGGDQHQLLLALRMGVEDRSGHELPDSSPRKSSYTDTESEDDTAKPFSLYGDWQYQLNDHNLRFAAHYSELDSYAEFLDFGTLSHSNRVNLESINLRLSDDWQLNSRAGLSLAVGYAQGEPGDKEKLNIVGENSYPKRDFRYQAADVAARFNYQMNADNNISFGADYTDDHEALIEIYSVNKDSGDEVLVSEPQDKKHFYNSGLFAQWLTGFGEKLDLTLNIRNDDNNLYGNDTTYRAAAVYNLQDNLNIKALYGTSYKAPAALQLFAQPLVPGEIIGNPDLEPETAKTAELAIHWTWSSHLSLSANIFSTEVNDKVELAPQGNNQQPQNIGEQDSKGAEVEIKAVYGRHLIQWQTSYQNTDTTLTDPFEGDIMTPSVMYPRWIHHLSWRYQHEPLGNFTAHIRRVSERRATDSNTLYNNLTPYELDPYTLIDAGYSKTFGDFEGYLQVHNLLNEDYEEPGFTGIDVPGRAREWRLGVIYRTN